MSNTYTKIKVPNCPKPEIQVAQNTKNIDKKLYNDIVLFLSACRYAGEGGLEKLRQDASELLKEIMDE